MVSKSFQRASHQTDIADETERELCDENNPSHLISEQKSIKQAW